MLSKLSKEAEELKESLQQMVDSNRFMEVRGPMGIDLRLPLEDLLAVFRELEERTMWLMLERDKAVALSEETKASAKQKSKAAGIEVAKVRSQLRRFHATFAALDPDFVNENGELDLDVVITRLKGTVNDRQAHVAARD